MTNDQMKFVTVKKNANQPCPCQSGLKVKKCCGFMYKKNVQKLRAAEYEKRRNEE